MHVPVLVKEILEHLNLKPGDNVIDATLDGGGHAKLFLRAIAPNGKVLGIEQDEKMIQTLKSAMSSDMAPGRMTWRNLIIVQGNFRNIKEIAEKHNFQPDAIFFDLGMSTWHLKESGKGFSFQKLDEPLDMRFSFGAKASAAEIINSFTKEKLAEIFKEYGEERKAHFFAQRVIDERKKKKIITVGNLIKALGTRHPKILARIFQYIRIYINDEINALLEGLQGAFRILRKSGIMAVISYHSLEDREVKNFFKKMEKEEDGKTFKKPIMPGREEIQANPSARSAKLRILWKI